MRILLLTVDFPPARGGIQNLIANLADGLAPSHDVTVVAPDRSGAADWDARRAFGVTRTLSARFWPLVMASFMWTGLIRAALTRPDVIVCGHILLGPVSYLLARLFGAPLIAFAYAYEIRAPRMQRLAGWTLRRSAAVVTISDFTRRAVMAHGVPADRIAVIYPGADSRPRIDSSPGAIESAPTDRVILTVSRLGELYKGHDMVIRAMPLVLAQVPNARYVIVGDGPLRGYLQRLASSLGVASAVTFAGEQPPSAVDEWYRRADVVTLMSRESSVDGSAEGFGLTCVEAGAWNKPVVAGRSGGIPDAVVDGVTGLLIDPLDSAAIAAALVRVLTDAELAQRLGDRGRIRALEQLSWPNFVAGFQSVLDTSATRPALAGTIRRTGSA